MAKVGTEWITYNLSEDPDNSRISNDKHNSITHDGVPSINQSEHTQYNICTNIRRKFKLCIAIDFGTDGIGLAYAYNGKIYVHSKWQSTRFASTIKPKTIILLDDEGEPNSFGMKAKYTYMDLNEKNSKKWMLFERFKMRLYGIHNVYKHFATSYFL